MVPFLSSANWGGQGLHPRGNFEAYTRSASPQRWLEVHGIEHWTEYYTDYGVDLQKRFFGHFLKGTDTGWDSQPRVLLQVRHVDRFVERAEDDWPIPRTDWRKMYLHANGQLRANACAKSGTLSYEATGDGLTFLTAPTTEEMEITGPLAAKLFVSSSTADADLFVVFRVFDPDGDEVVFMGAVDPNTPIAQGWLRASHRKLDPELSLPWRPYHTHLEADHQPLVPGEIYELDIEIWPTCIVVPPGYRIGFSVRGRDYEYGGDTSGLMLSNFKNELRGCGPFLHNDPRDRPPEIFENEVTLHFGPDQPNHVLVPVIPPA